MNFTHSGIVRTMDGTAKIYFSQNNICDIANTLSIHFIPADYIFGFLSFNGDEEGGSVELKKMSKKLGVNFIEEYYIESDKTIYMYNMYISLDCIWDECTVSDENPDYFYITQSYNNYFLIHVYTPHYCSCQEETDKEYVITDIVSH